MKNQMCIVCRDNPANSIQLRIRQIRDFLRQVEPDTSNKYSFNWNFNTRCKFGLRCEEAERIISRIERDIDDINARLVTVALNSDSRIYNQTLYLLRGYFPAVYNQLVRLHSCGE